MSNRIDARFLANCPQKTANQTDWKRDKCRDRSNGQADIAT